MKITLRPITPEDRPFEIELMTATWKSMYDLMPLPEDQKAKIIDQQVFLQRKSYEIEFPDAMVVGILADGELVGRYIYASRPTEILFIDIAILPQFQSQGIGMSVIQPQLDEVESHQKTAFLHVKKGNSRAHKLYDKLGFELCDETDTHFKMKLSPRV